MNEDPFQMARPGAQEDDKQELLGEKQNQPRRDELAKDASHFQGRKSTWFPPSLGPSVNLQFVPPSSRLKSGRQACCSCSTSVWCVGGKRARMTSLLVYRSLDNEQLPLDQIKKTAHYLKNLGPELGPVQTGPEGSTGRAEGRVLWMGRKSAQIFGWCLERPEGYTASYTPRFVLHFSLIIMPYLGS